MTFADLNFIFRLVPIFLIIYYITPAKFRPWILLCASLGFYYTNEPKLIVVMLAGVFVNWLIARFNKEKKNKVILGVAIVLDLALMISFKVCGALDLGVVIPVGLSYFVFKLISYQIDLYKGMIENVSLRDMTNYFLMFPQVISGPISRYDYLMANDTWNKGEGTFSSRLFGVLGKIEEGLKYFVLGLFMKVIIADHLAILWNDIKTIGYESISTPLAWLGAYSYSLNLYFDFWGYSLMAAGLGMMIGFPFISNFDQPYFATSISDFYRRWHSTLGLWFRDYLYFPLGGNRKGKLRTGFNIFVVWLCTGLWHGFTYNFLIWAGAICLVIMVEKFLLSKNELLIKVLGRFNVWVIIPITWVAFAIHSFKNLRVYLLRMFPVIDVGIAVNHSDYIKILKNYGVYLGLGLLLTLPIVTTLYKKYKGKVLVIFGLFVMFWITIFSLANSAGNPFMYLRF